MTKRDPEPRLLNQRQAAAYCGLCISNFVKVCPIQPVNLLSRIPRYDRYALDRWIDTLDNSQPMDGDVDIIEMWDDGRDSRAYQGH